MREHHSGDQKGFTLIELMSVVTIVGILSAIAFPQFSSYRNRGFEGRVEADLRHVAIAEEAYFVDNEVYRSCVNQSCVSQLSGILALSPGVTLQITATTTGFTGTAAHPSIPTVCRWDNSQKGFLGCS